MSDKSEQDKTEEIESYAINNLMQVKNYRDFMWRSLTFCCTFNDVFDSDPMNHARNSGVRSHGVWLSNKLKEAAPEYYFKMLEENKNA